MIWYWQSKQLRMRKDYQVTYLKQWNSMPATHNTLSVEISSVESDEKIAYRRNFFTDEYFLLAKFSTDENFLSTNISYQMVLDYLVGRNFVGEKWRKNCLVTNFFTDEYFLLAKFSTDKYFLPTNIFSRRIFFTRWF